MSDRARGWFEMAASPIKAFQERRQADAARAERADQLKAGASMKLLSKAVPAGTPVKLTLSADGALLTWQSVELVNGMPKESGVLALSELHEVKAVREARLLRSSGEVPCQFSLVADGQTVRLEAESEAQKVEWMEALQERCASEKDAKSERKMGHNMRRRMEMEERRKEAEKRKAAVLATCQSKGMVHTAQAMMNRG